MEMLVFYRNIQLVCCWHQSQFKCPLFISHSRVCSQHNHVMILFSPVHKQWLVFTDFGYTVNKLQEFAGGASGPPRRNDSDDTKPEPSNQTCPIVNGCFWANQFQPSSGGHIDLMSPEWSTLFGCSSPLIGFMFLFALLAWTLSFWFIYIAVIHCVCDWNGSGGASFRRGMRIDVTQFRE